MLRKRDIILRRIQLAVLFSLLLAGSNALAQQIVLEEDFEDQDLTQNPVWTGEIGDFITIEESGNNILQLNADPNGDGTSEIATVSNTAQGSWEFYYRFGESPSGSNRTRIFLISDTNSFEQEVNGYALSIGESGGDPVRLMRYDNGNEIELLSSITEIEKDQGYQIRVERNASFEWKLLISKDIGSTPVQEGEEVRDDTYQTSDYFGFLLNYTSTRIDDFFFDNVIIENSESFDMVSAEVVTANEIDVIFNFKVDNTTLDLFDFSVSGGLENPSSLALTDDFTVRLSYDSVLPEGDYTITANDINNIFGGTIATNSSVDFSVVNPFEVRSVDVINASRISIDFTQPPDERSWSRSDFEITEAEGSTEVINPVSIEYDDRSEPTVIYLNLGSSLAIGDYELIINKITSTDSWPISGENRFDFTVSNPFVVTDFEALNRSEFEITFSQDVDLSTLDPSDFNINSTASNTAQLIESNRVRISFENEVNVGDQELIINNIYATTGWEIEANTIIEFILFDEYEKGDLAINELYYRVPAEWRTSVYDRPQYIEIVNRTDKLLNLRNFTINGDNISIDENLPIEPNEYLVVARGVPVFEDQFGDRNFVEADQFPELLLTTSDNIILETNENEVVESFTYDAAEWGGNEVALERYSLNVSAEIRDNWDASEDILTGSPGLPNTIQEPVNSPEVESISFSSPATLQVTYTRTLSDDAIDDLDNFSLDNGAVIVNAEFSSDQRTITFDLGDLLEDKFEYTFAYQKVQDIFGNEVSGTQEFTFTFKNPFRVISTEVVNHSDLLIQFTLPLQVSTVDLSDFTLKEGEQKPSAFSFDNSETVRLTFDSPFSPGSYEILVNNIESLTKGWQIEENSSASFFRFDSHREGDILITEFMYNPPDGYPQYVEIYNQSNRFLNLRDFKLLRSEGSSSLGGIISDIDYPIKSGEYLVVTEDSDLLKNIFGPGPWIEMEEFPGFTQTVSDQIRLMDSNGEPAEVIDYDPNLWGGTDISLERRSNIAPANNPKNWEESLSRDLGTPGEENTVSPDEGPELISASFLDAETVLVSFRGSLDTELISADNFDINHGRTITDVRFINSTQAELSLDARMNSGQNYTLTVSRIPDIFGNELDQDQVSFTYYFVERAEPGDVVINEFMYNEPEGYTEYVELFNNSAKVFNLSGWQQANDTGTRRTLTEEQVYFPPGSFMVILPNEELRTIFPDMKYLNAGSSLPALKNSGDEIVITNADGVTIDSLRYGTEWGGDEVALERMDQSAVSFDVNNWDESLSVLKGTPGMENSVDISTEGPELLQADFINQESIRVLFSGALDRSKITRRNFEISGGITIDKVTFTRSTEAVLFLRNPLDSGKKYTVAVRDIPDIFGNILDNAEAFFTYYLIETAEPGDVVINEIMYDEPENYTEYIELYNVSDKAIDLAGWQQANDTSVRNTLTEDQVILPPNSYIAILPNFNLLNIFPEIPFLNAASSLSTLKNGGDNVIIANADGVIIDSLRYSPMWGGDGVSLERRRANRSSLYSENWADSPNDRNGTPGMPNEVEKDFNFRITDARAVSPSLIRLTFNAGLREGELKTAYFIVDDKSPGSISIESENIILLKFTEPFQSGRKRLRIDNKLRSAGGFQIVENEVIQFTVFDMFSEGDVVINEFMYRPPSGYVRYVELVNRSDKLLNLREWRLQRRNVTGDPDRIISEDDLELKPNEMIVLSEDSNALQNIFGERNFYELSSFPDFTVTVADQIRLFTKDNTIVDSLQYEPSEWGGNGVALERLSQKAPTRFRENWEESPNELLGTPGLPNDVETDINSPKLVRWAQYQDQGFVLTFSERLNSDQAMDDENYSISPELPISMIALDRNEVILFPGNELINDQEYEISIQGIRDIFGNEMEPTRISIRYLEFGDADPGQIVINEMMVEPSDRSASEFIEIYNRMDENFDLTGWFLGDLVDESEIPRGVLIRENDYLVFTDSQTFASESDKIIFLSDFQSLNNSGDAITLKKPSGTIIDSLFYQAEWGTDKEGISLERKDPEGLSTDPGNWNSSISKDGSTPALKNSIFEVDVTPPIVLFANFMGADSIEVEFNEHINLSVSQENRFVKGGGYQNSSYSNTQFLINGIPADLLYQDKKSGSRIILDGSMVSLGEEVTLSVENLQDYKGNRVSYLQSPIAQPISEGDIIFNEIMFDPISDERDGLPNQSQYIEIYNRRSYAISLEGFILHDEPNENSEVSIIKPINSNHQWLPSNGYAMIYPEPDEITFSNSRIANFFNLGGDMEEFAIQTNRSTLSLTNSGRQIYLADSTMKIIDKVDYLPEWHNPNIVDTKGISLERINPDTETNEESNWSSNATPMGGSPGFKNSINQESGQSITGNDLTFTPNPFSPDGDGFEDNLLINYSFDEPDYLIKVRIYDRYGRLIRKLAESKRAGFNGSLIWDGKTGEGLRNRVGIYIVLLEAYNSARGKNLTFKKTVVIARQF